MLKRLRLIPLAAFVLTTCVAVAEPAGPSDWNVSAANKLIAAAKSGDKMRIAKLFQYPFTMETPLRGIGSPDEMVKRLGEVFDDKIISEIANSDLNKDWSTVGWRGVMFKNGLVWVDYDGQITWVNYKTAEEKQERDALIADQKAHIFQTLKTFKDPILKWKTKNYLVRIDRMADGSYRYAAWGAQKTESDKPNLVLLNGVSEADGNGGNGHYVFKTGNYTYTVYENVLGPGDEPPGDLEVRHSNKVILNEPVLEVIYGR